MYSFSRLYATDIKIVPEVVSVHDEQLPMTQHNLTNYPNPFNPTTTISFETTNSHELTQIEIYNIKGQKVKSFPIYQSTNSQVHQIVWNGTDENDLPVSSGIYFYKLTINGNTVASKKCMLLK